MDNFTPEQFERYEAYRRSALPKQTVRKARALSTLFPNPCPLTFHVGHPTNYKLHHLPASSSSRRGVCESVCWRDGRKRCDMAPSTVICC